MYPRGEVFQCIFCGRHQTPNHENERAAKERTVPDNFSTNPTTARHYDTLRLSSSSVLNIMSSICVMASSKAISSLWRENVNMSRFSIILLKFDVLASITSFFCKAHRNIICACVLPYFNAKALIVLVFNDSPPLCNAFEALIVSLCW